MSNPITSERLDQIKAALGAVPTPPWQWIGDRRTGPLLTTTHSGWEYLLGVEHPKEEHGGDVEDSEGRRALGDLLFRDKPEGERWATMRPAKELAVGRTSYDPDTIRDIDNPVARLLRDAPQYVAELLAEVERLRKAAGPGRAHRDVGQFYPLAQSTTPADPPLRVCNGCGEPLRTATPDEVAAVANGDQVSDVRRECPDCLVEASAGRIEAARGVLR